VDIYIYIYIYARMIQIQILVLIWIIYLTKKKLKPTKRTNLVWEIKRKTINS